MKDCVKCARNSYVNISYKSNQILISIVGNYKSAVKCVLYCVYPRCVI